MTVRDRARDRENGSGTVLVIGLVAVELALAAFLAALGGAQAARSQAQTAADLAALAGASALRSGHDGCAAAARVVARHGASVAECVGEGDGVVRVVVRHPVGGVAGAWTAGRDAEAVARAGPRPATAGEVAG